MNSVSRQISRESAVSYHENINSGLAEVTLGDVASTSREFSLNNDLNEMSSTTGAINFVLGEDDDADVDNMAKYDDFDTIDWTRDRQQDRIRFRRMKRMKQGSWFEKLMEAHDALSGWLVVLLVGLSCGLFAGVVDIGADWMSDLKEGICADQFWFDKESCCWADNSSVTEVGCSQWKTWAEVFNSSSAVGSYVSNYFMYTVFALLFAVVCVTLVHTFAPYACGSGIPEIKTMLGGFIIHGYMGFWTLVIKSLGMMLAVAAGLSLGKEGPLVHIACCCGNVFAKLFPKYRKNEAKKREVLSAASAAGVSVAFGAPIGGILFSLEEVSYYFPMKTLWRSFFCAMVASVTLKYMNPYGTGKLVLFYVKYNTPWKFFELIPFTLLGIFGGLFGVFFNKLNLWWCKLRKTTKLGDYPTTELASFYEPMDNMVALSSLALRSVLIVTLVTALFAYLNPFTRENTSLLIKDLFQQCEPDDYSDLCDYVRNTTLNVNRRHYPAAEAGSGVIKSIWMLVLAMLFKAIVTVFTFGIKVPAGLFIPSMAVGACVGRIVGIGMEQLVLYNPDLFIFKSSCGKSIDTCIQPGLYAMVGAAAALGGVTRMTVSLVVIMFELTGGFVYIVPMMLAVVMSKWVGDAFGKGGIYDGHIALNGYPFLDNKEEFAYTSLAEDVAKPRKFEAPISCISKDSSTIEELEILLEETNFKGFPVVDDMDSMRLFGYVRRKDLKVALESARQKNTEMVSLSVGYFTKHAPRTEATHLPPINLRHTLDESPLQVTGSTPMENVVEVFRKLGLRQVLVTRDGGVTGIITKKDVIKHVAVMERKRPDVVRYGTL